MTDLVGVSIRVSGQLGGREGEGVGGGKEEGGREGGGEGVVRIRERREGEDRCRKGRR